MSVGLSRCMLKSPVMIGAVAASERKELNSSRNLEKGTRRLTDGGGR